MRCDGRCSRTVPKPVLSTVVQRTVLVVQRTRDEFAIMEGHTGRPPYGVMLAKCTTCCKYLDRVACNDSEGGTSNDDV